MCDCSQLLYDIEQFIAKADDSLKDSLKAAGYISPDKTVKGIARLEDRVTNALLDETEYIASSMDRAIDIEAYANEIWPGVKLNDDSAEKLNTIFAEELNQNLPDLAESYVKRIDPELTIATTTNRTQAWIKGWSAELGSKMQLSSHKEIESILASALQDGKGALEVARMLREEGIRNEYIRARSTAVTEMLRAHSYAMQEAMIQSPAVDRKKWKHTGSYRNEPRQNHVAMDGQIVAKDEPFTLYGVNGVYNPMMPRDATLPPEESINCHCIVEPIASDDVMGLPYEERKRLQEEARLANDEAWRKEIDNANYLESFNYIV